MCDDGREFDTAMHVHIMATVSTYAGLEMYAEIDNHDIARLDELQLPLIDLDTACDETRENDIMYRMNGYGDIQPNPWTAVRDMNHTEYVTADDKPVWCTMTYPSICTMAWFGLQTGGHFLYLGKQDTRFETQLFSIGASPRGHEPQLILTTSPCRMPDREINSILCVALFHSTKGIGAPDRIFTTITQELTGIHRPPFPIGSKT